MAKYKVQGPDGAIHVFEGPDDATPQQIEAFASQHFSAPQPAAIDFSGPDDDVRAAIAKLPAQDQDKALRQWAKSAIAREREKGFKPGPTPAKGIPIIGQYLDEAAAGVDSVLNTVTMGRVGRPYDEALAFQRERDRQSVAADPAAATIGRLATGIVTGAPLFAGTAGAMAPAATMAGRALQGAVRATRITPAATLAGRVGQGLGIGAGVGAIEGFGAGEGSVGDRIQKAGDTAKFGAVVGGALPVVGAAATRALGAAQEHIVPRVVQYTRGVDEAADTILANKIRQAGQTPASVRADLAQGQQRARLDSNSRATLPETIADTTDTTRRLLGSVYRSGGEAGDFVSTQLQNRQRGINGLFTRLTGQGPDGQGQRVVDATERALRIKSAGTALQTERRVRAELRQQADDLYSQARQAQEAFDLDPVLARFEQEAAQNYGSVRTTLLRALNLFRPRDGQMAPDNLTRFDRAKRALDDLIEQAQRQGRGANTVRQLTEFKRGLLDAVEGVTDGQPTRNLLYRQARETYGTNAENVEAINLGRAALRENSEISAEQFRDLTTGQQQLFRIGFLESLRNSLGSKKPGDDITRLFQTNRVRQLMTEIIPRSRGQNAVFTDRAERFGDIITREGRMVQTRNQTLGNSATAQRQADDMEFAGQTLANMYNRFRQAPTLFNMGVEAIGTAVQRVFGYRQDVSLALARRLLETDQTTRDQILRRLANRRPGGLAMLSENLDRANQTLIGATVDPEYAELAE